MQLGLIGLGKMGGNMRDRMKAAGIEVIGYDTNREISDVADLAELVEKLDAPRNIWVMVPAGKITDSVMSELQGLLAEGDLVIDGGNSKWSDDQGHAEQFAKTGVHCMDCGVSGGIWGKENGYGLMHAYAEGWELLEAKDIVTDVHGCFKAWTRGTVVRSWLLDLMVKALEETPHLEGVSEYSTDSGEGRWTLEEAIANAVPMPVLAAALFGRFASRQENSPQMQAVAALRGQFGGHEVMQFGREPWRAAKEGQAEVSGAAEPKKDAGAARPGAAPDEH